ncbi:thioredoxin domain-containing protein [bacterium]|nr:thioredoxin domain-containing protein [bacterium]
MTLRLRFLAILGILISLVLLWEHNQVKYGLSSGNLSFCHLNEIVDCSAIAKSQYSEIFGIPNPVLAVVTYIFILLGLQRYRADTQRQFNFACFWSYLLIFATVVFAIISFVIIKKICIFCTFIYVVNLTFAAVVIKWKRENLQVERPRLSELLITGLSAVEAKTTFLSVIASIIFGIICVGSLTYFSNQLALAYVDINSHKELHDSRLALEHWLNTPPSQELKIDDQRDFYKGDVDAPVEIVMFSDFECPGCRKLSGFFDDLIEEYKTKVKFIYKNFPLHQECNPNLTTLMHPQACYFAELARCAGRERPDYFWEIYAAIIADSVNENNATQVLSSIGANPTQVLKCVNDHEEIQQVISDAKLGGDIGVNSTPTVFINKIKIEIPFTPESIKLIVDSLAKSKR